MTKDDDWTAFLHEHGIDASTSPEGRPRRTAEQSSMSAASRRHLSWMVGLAAVAASAAGGLWWLLAGEPSPPGSDVLTPESSAEQPYEDSELDPMFNREVGDCFMYAEEVMSDRMRTCDEPHDAEIASTFQYPGIRMPSADSDYMQKRCSRAANQYLGPDRAGLPLWQISWSIPTIPLWDQGYRDSSCIVVFDEEVKRTMQNAGR